MGRGVWINVPLAVGALAVVAWLVPESSDPAAARVDVGSAVLVTAGMSGVVLAVVVAGEAGVARPAVGSGAGVAAVGLAWFAVRQRRARTPLIDFTLYRDRRFSGAGVAAALLTLGTGSALFVLTQYLQVVLGFTALQAGAALTPLAAGVVAGSSAGGRAPARIGARSCVVAGFLAVAAGFAVLAASAPGYPPVAVGLTLLGLGTGFSSPAVTSTVLGAVPRHRAGMGSALNDTHQQLGIALGVAVIGSLLASVYRGHLPATGGHDGSVAATLAHAAATGDEALAEAARAAFTHAQSVTMLVAAACAACGALVAAMTLRPATPSPAGPTRRP